MFMERRFKGTKLGGMLILALIGYCFFFVILGWLFGWGEEDLELNQIDNIDNVYLSPSFDQPATSPFSHQWTVNDLSKTEPKYGEVHMAAHDGHLFLLGNTDYAVTKIDAASGEVSRGYLRYSAPYSARTSTLEIESGILLMGFYGTQKISGEIKWGASKIVALDVQSGEFMWETKIPGARFITTMDACSETIGVNGSFSSNDYVLDINTGSILRETKKSRDSFIRFIDHDTIYKISEDSPLSAYSESNRLTLWSASLRQPIYQPIQCHTDFLLVRTYRSNQIGTVYSISQASGEINWKFSSVTSNIDSNEEFAFFFTTDKRLLAVDIWSGEIKGEIQFDYQTDATKDSNHPLSVAVDNDLVFAYFGNSDQLLAFKFNLN